MSDRRQLANRDDRPKKRRKVSFAKMRLLFGTDSEDSDDEELIGLSETVHGMKIGSGGSLEEMMKLLVLKEGGQ